MKRNNSEIHALRKAYGEISALAEKTESDQLKAAVYTLYLAINEYENHFSKYLKRRILHRPIETDDYVFRFYYSPISDRYQITCTSKHADYVINHSINGEYLTDLVNTIGLEKFLDTLVTL